jgi:hypothetical protein
MNNSETEDPEQKKPKAKDHRERKGTLTFQNSAPVTLLGT